MMIHHLKHFLSEIVALGVLIVPVAVALTALIGLASWILGGQEIGLRASWITWCATMGVVPIFLRLSCGPDTRMICDRCITALKRRLHHSFGRCVQKERRRHARYRVDFPATFSNDRTRGFGVIADVSAGGCRITSKAPFVAGEFGQLLINLPDGIAPLTVSHALVRWVKGQECGIEFIRMEPNDKGWLSRMTSPNSQLTMSGSMCTIHGMARLCACLALLLLLLTFNAYACVLPTPTPSQMGCSSTTQEPIRQTCDAFLEIGPHSEHSSNHSLFTIHADFDVAVPLLDTTFTVSLSAEPLRRLDTPIHPSIQTTVLRI